MKNEPLRVDFLLVDGFMMAAFVLALDALRLANWRSGQRHFRWSVRTSHDKQAEANNGMIVQPDGDLLSGPNPDAVFICAGFSPERGCTRRVLSWLRSVERGGAVLGGWDTGPLILAEAGLMHGRRMAIHWQVASSVRDRYPDIEITSDGFEVGNRRLTGAGGLPTFDLMLEFIGGHAGPATARAVAESANRHTLGLGDVSWMGLVQRDNHDAQWVSKAMGIMAQQIEIPMGIPVIANLCGRSERSFYRDFRRATGMSPKSFYLQMRLQRARDLLMQSNLSITEVAMMTGFSSLSRLSQAYRNHFGDSPRSARKRSAWLDMPSRSVPTRARGGLIMTESEI